MAKIKAVCVSEKKGEQKHEVGAVSLLAGHGIESDAHAGDWHRQVSLLGVESVRRMQETTELELRPGAFAENLLTEGIVLVELPVGTRLRTGGALLEVTQIGKECHGGCAIRQACGDCVMPREGIFCRVLEPGLVRAGDSLEALPD